MYEVITLLLFSDTFGAGMGLCMAFHTVPYIDKLFKCPYMASMYCA